MLKRSFCIITQVIISHPHHLSNVLSPATSAENPPPMVPFIFRSWFIIEGESSRLSMRIAQGISTRTEICLEISWCTSHQKLRLSPLFYLIHYCQFEPYGLHICHLDHTGILEVLTPHHIELSLHHVASYPMTLLTEVGEGVHGR